MDHHAFPSAWLCARYFLWHQLGAASNASKRDPNVTYWEYFEISFFPALLVLITNFDTNLFNGSFIGLVTFW